MASAFPAILRRFRADARCVKQCRELYDSVEPDGAQKPFVTFEQNGGSDVSAWGTDADQIDAVFVIHSGHIQPEKARIMADEVMRAFDDRNVYAGNARITIHRTGPPEITRPEKTYEARIPYNVISVLRTETPAVIGNG